MSDLPPGRCFYCQFNPCKCDHIPESAHHVYPAEPVDDAEHPRHGYPDNPEDDGPQMRGEYVRARAEDCVLCQSGTCVQILRDGVVIHGTWSDA